MFTFLTLVLPALLNTHVSLSGVELDTNMKLPGGHILCIGNSDKKNPTNLNPQSISFSTNLISCFTIILTSFSKLVSLGFHPNCFMALVGSPKSESTSVGL